MQIHVVGEKWLEMVVKRTFRSVANFEQQCLGLLLMIMLLMVQLIKITTVSGKFWCLSIHTSTQVYIVAVLDLVVRANALVWIVAVWYFIARTTYKRK